MGHRCLCYKVSLLFHYLAFDLSSSAAAATACLPTATSRLGSGLRAVQQLWPQPEHVHGPRTASRVSASVSHSLWLWFRRSADPLRAFLLLLVEREWADVENVSASRGSFLVEAACAILSAAAGATAGLGDHQRVVAQRLLPAGVTRRDGAR